MSTKAGSAQVDEQEDQSMKENGRMKKFIALCLVILVIASTATVTLASSGDEQIPSAKTAAKMDYVNVTDDTMGWYTLDNLTSKIKTGGVQDLLIFVSAESALTTDVELYGDLGSEAEATVEFRVLVDGEVVMIPNNPDPDPVTPGNQYEGGVVFNNRYVKLEGDLAHHITYVYPCDANEDGVIEEGEVCESTDGFEDGSYIVIDDHWINLYMSSRSANAFNFFTENVGQGVHTIEVQARATSSATGETGGVTKHGKKQEDYSTEPNAAAVIGNASVVVEEVNLKGNY